MAKTSSIQRNLKRIRLSKRFLKKRESLKKIIKDKKATLALLEAMNFPFYKKKEKNWGTMAKTSAIQRNLKRIRLVKKFLKKRENLKKIIKIKNYP